MKNVAKRLLNGDLARMLIAWKCNWMDEKRELEARERGEAIMKRVGGRWLNREASDAFRNWHGKYFEEKAQARAEAIMRRVGARMRNKEKAMNYAEWARNAKNDLATMWQNRIKKLEEVIETLELKLLMVSKKEAGRLLRKWAGYWRYKEGIDLLMNWKEAARQSYKMKLHDMLLKKIMGRWRNRGVSDICRQWKQNVRGALNDKMSGSAGSIITRVLQRWKLNSWAVVVRAWYNNMRGEGLSTVVHKAAVVKENTQVNSLYAIVNITARWLHKSAISSMQRWKIAFKDSTRADKNRAQTAAIMRFVAKRMVELGVMYNLDMNMLNQLVNLFAMDRSMKSELAGIIN